MPTSSLASNIAEKLFNYKDEPERPAVQPEDNVSNAAVISNPQEPRSIDNVLDEIEEDSHCDADKKQYEFIEGEPQPPRRSSHAVEKRRTIPGEDPDVHDDPRPEDFRRKRSTTEPALGFGQMIQSKSSLPRVVSG